jgi:HAD superfamily hydrolase (TIGR01509 family)
MPTATTNGCDLIIFDCDGVLLDSEIILARAHAKAFSRAGWPVSELELLRRFVGIADPDMYRTVELELGRALPNNHDAFVKTEIERAYREDLQAVVGVHSVVASIKLPICVASSSSPSKLKLGLTLVNLHEQFAPNIFSATMVARGKPAPDLFLFAAQQMNVASSRCVVIEDSVAGVRAAVAAGMPVIGFCGASHCGAQHAATLMTEGAIATAKSMAELGPILKSLASVADTH